MWQINLMLEAPVTDELVAAMLPDGFVPVPGDAGLYTIVESETSRQVGICLVMAGGMTWGFDETNAMGLELATAIGETFPEVNPATILHGFVYRVAHEGGDRYRLETLPFGEFRKAIINAKQEVAAGNAYFVTFHRGDWHKKTLKVLSKMRLWMTGELDINTGGEILRLVSD